MTPFRFVLLALLCYRAQRVFTTDDWPPSKWFRKRIIDNSIVKQTDHDGPLWGYIADFFTCPWCFGSILTFALVALDEYVWRFPTVLLVAGAAAAIVGQIGQRDE